VRANQKDLYYLSQLGERIEDVARSFLGPSLPSPIHSRGAELTRALRRDEVAAEVGQGALAGQPARLLWPHNVTRCVLSLALLTEDVPGLIRARAQALKPSARSTATSCSTRPRTDARPPFLCVPFTCSKTLENVLADVLYRACSDEPPSSSFIASSPTSSPAPTPSSAAPSSAATSRTEPHKPRSIRSSPCRPRRRRSSRTSSRAPWTASARSPRTCPRSRPSPRTTSGAYTSPSSTSSGGTTT